MGGIVGYVGQRSVQEILLAGLEKLEYRGYDSAGISIQSESGLEAVRAVGNLSALRGARAEGRGRTRAARGREGVGGVGGARGVGAAVVDGQRPNALGHPRPRDRG